jgi:hypothetical protein
MRILVLRTNHDCNPFLSRSHPTQGGGPKRVFTIPIAANSQQFERRMSTRHRHRTHNTTKPTRANIQLCQSAITMQAKKVAVAATLMVSLTTKLAFVKFQNSKPQRLENTSMMHKSLCLVQEIEIVQGEEKYNVIADTDKEESSRPKTKLV